MKDMKVSDQMKYVVNDEGKSDRKTEWKCIKMIG